MPTKREAAHIAARRCFSVFPIAPNTKTPLIANWQNLATQDPKQIDAWWDEWPDANIAGVTENFVVVDIDPRNGAEDTMRVLMDVQTFPNTVRNETAGGGDHLIYATDKPVKGGTNKLGKGVDIKARGGYILLPGSVIDGKEYKWLNDRPIAPAPQWILDQCAVVKPKTDAAGKRLVEEDDTAVELATAWMLGRAPTAEYGEIDDTTFKVAARLYDFGVSIETATEIMLEWNDLKCNPPGDIERLQVVTESAGRNRENAIGSKHPAAPGFEAVEIDETKAPTAITEPKKAKFFAIRADEGARDALKRRGEPLIKGVINCGTMSVLIGAPGGGKTFLVLDWAYHIAKGIPWAGKPVKQGAVVYLAAEAGNMIMSRLTALEQHYGPLGDAPLYIVPCGADLVHGPDDAKALVALIAETERASGQKVVLFVVDTVSRAMAGGDENSSKDMGALILAVDFIRAQAKCHGMMIHHPNKAGTSARGHSNMLGGTDTEMQVEDKVLSFTKQRDMVEGPDIKFKLLPVAIGKDGDGEPITSCVVHVSKPGDAEPRGELTGRLRDVWDTLDAALKDAGRTAFDMAFLRKISFRHSSDNGPSRITIIGWMSELSENGYIRKATRGQWVVSNVGNVGMLSD